MVDRRDLDTCSYGRMLAGVRTVAVTRDGRSVYVAGVFGIAVFARSSTTGLLKQLDGSGGRVSSDGLDPARLEIEHDFNADVEERICAAENALLGPANVALSADGRSVYVTAAGSSALIAFARDPASGVLRRVAGSGGCVEDDQSGGEDEGCATASALGDAWSASVSPDGRNVYVAAPASDAVSVFARDPQTGAVTRLSGPLGCVSAVLEGCMRADGVSLPVSVAVSADGRTAYVVSVNELAVFKRDRKTGALTELPRPYGCFAARAGMDCRRLATLAYVRAVALTPDGRFAYAVAGRPDDDDTAPGTNAVGVLRRTRS